VFLCRLEGRLVFKQGTIAHICKIDCDERAEEGGGDLNNLESLAIDKFEIGKPSD
jgi:hypothetical protein